MERRARSGWLPVALLAAYCGAHLLNNTGLDGAAVRAALEGLQAATGGLVEPLLPRSLIVLAAFLGVRWLAVRRGPARLGWQRAQLWPALRTTLACWGAMQAGLLVLTWVRGEPVEWHRMWERRGVQVVLGGVLAQALGHSLVEETVFRGYFLARLRRRWQALGEWRSTALALVASSLLFGLAHLGTRVLVMQVRGPELVQEQGHFFLAGMAFGALYLATGNLFLTVALHTLINDPAPLVQASGTAVNGVCLAVLTGVMATSWWLGWRRAPQLEHEVRPLFASTPTPRLEGPNPPSALPAPIEEPEEESIQR